MGACSSKPKTAEFEGSMNFYLQEELARKNLDDEQKGGCYGGVKSIDPEQKLSSKNSPEQKGGCYGGVKSIDPEQKLSSKCALQNLRPAMENGRMGDVLLELEKKRLAGSRPENNEKETCARAEGNMCKKLVGEGVSQVPKICTDTLKLQKITTSVAQELYEESAFAQKKDVLESVRNTILFEEEVVLESPQKVAFRVVEKGKFQTLENINEDKELPVFEGLKPRIDAEEGNPVSCRVIQEPVFLASRVATVEPEGLVYGAQRDELEEPLKEQSAAPLIVSCKTQDSESGKGADKQVKEAHIATSMGDELPCHLSNFTELRAKHSTSRDENLGTLETEKPLIGLVNSKVEDDSMAWKLGNEASDMISGKDGTQVGLKKGSKESFFVADTSESITTEPLDSQTPNLSKVPKEASSIQEEEYTSKQELDLIFCQDEIKVLKVVVMSKEQVIDNKRHSAAFQPPQTFEELHVVEPPRSIYGKDMASDMDEMLEKLASEFERQESLSSFLP